MYEMGHVTLTTPLSWVVCHPKVNTWYSLHIYKI